MNQYRQLTEQEIDILENNSCWSEDWSRVMVADFFKPNYFHRVMFYGDIRLGKFEKMVEERPFLRTLQTELKLEGDL